MIPLEQGSVFRPNIMHHMEMFRCLNPFGTGQCLPTINFITIRDCSRSLNPFGTGQCLPTKTI